MDCDGDTDSVDALGILRAISGLPVSQPGGCPPIGITALVIRDKSDRGLRAPPAAVWLSIAFVLPAFVLTRRR